MKEDCKSKVCEPLFQETHARWKLVSHEISWKKAPCHQGGDSGESHGRKVIWLLVFPRTLQGHRAGTHFWQALCTHSKLKRWKQKSNDGPVIWTLTQSWHSAKVRGLSGEVKRQMQMEVCVHTRWVPMATRKSLRASQGTRVYSAASVWVQKGNQRQMLRINDTQMARATCPFPRETEAASTLFFSAGKGRINAWRSHKQGSFWCYFVN